MAEDGASLRWRAADAAVAAVGVREDGAVREMAGGGPALLRGRGGCMGSWPEAGRSAVASCGQRDGWWRAQAVELAEGGKEEQAEETGGYYS